MWRFKNAEKDVKVDAIEEESFQWINKCHLDLKGVLLVITIDNWFVIEFVNNIKIFLEYL